ncbi:MAG: N-formylglutamate amidohydrolase [Pseudomonadota bacterium]
MTYQPFHIYGNTRPGKWLITCDHAANTVPQFVGGGDLGMAPEDMQRHIAYDIGASGVAQALGEELDSPVICANFSRLVIDPNRGEADPTLLMKLYDGTIIPANRHAGDAERQKRLDACYHPYHQALSALAARQEDTVICAVHSFTPQLRGRAPRPWQVGVLYAYDARLAHPLMDALRAEPDLTVGDNEPYKGHLPGDAIDKHALHHGRLNVLIELRNDLIDTGAQQRQWAARLASKLAAALAATNP